MIHQLLIQHDPKVINGCSQAIQDEPKDIQEDTESDVDSEEEFNVNYNVKNLSVVQDNLQDDPKVSLVEPEDFPEDTEIQQVDPNETVLKVPQNKVKSPQNVDSDEVTNFQEALFFCQKITQIWF